MISTAEMIELTAASFSERRKSGELWQLLDVREPWETEIASIAGALCIPMSEVPDRLHDLERDRPVAVLCHSGVRSARVANWLIRQGFATVANMVGGIEAWAVEFDPAIPRY